MELLLQCNPLERQSRALAFVPAVHWLRRYLTEFQLVAMTRRRFGRLLSQPARTFFDCQRLLSAYDIVCSETEQNCTHPTASRYGWIAGAIVVAVRFPAVLRGVDHRQNIQYVRWQWQAFTRSAMFEAKQLQRHALECLRLQADCTQLAGVARSPNVQSHFVSMARFWGTLAVLGPSPDAGPKLSKAEMQT
jgi:hypothetical protein